MKIYRESRLFIHSKPLLRLRLSPALWIDMLVIMKKLE